MVDQTDAVQQHFGAVAASYVTSAVHARGPDLAELVRVAAPTGRERVIDLGCAAGHAALAIAPHVASVIGIDITAEMLVEARGLAAERGLANVSFERADVSALPFGDASFDLAISRFSAHHWPEPRRGLSQIVRVLRAGGRFILIDTVGPPDAEADAFIDQVERLRDPSHRRDWTPAEWLEMFGEVGLGGRVVQEWDLDLDFDVWVARMQTPADRTAQLRRLLEGAPEPVKSIFHIVHDDTRRAFTLPCAMFEGSARRSHRQERRSSAK